LMNEADIKTSLGFSGLVNAGDYAAIGRAQNAPLEIGASGQRQIHEMVEDRRSKDLFLQGRAGELSEQLVTAKPRLKEEPLVAARRAAFARQKARGKPSGTFEEWQQAGRFGAAVQDLFGLGRYSQVNVETMRTLEAERARLGIEKPSVLGSKMINDRVFGF